ncbi:MAG TPA: SH3 domain-containing protein [Niastella sp.]
MKTLLLILSITLTNFSFAQDEPNFPDMRSWALYGNDTIDRYIFADTALIRSTPDTKQAPVDTLFAGDNITIAEITSKALTIRGLKGPWLKINYTKNGEQKNGYVWQGLVSCMPLRRGDIKFVYAIERRADSTFRRGKFKDTLRRYLVRLKVVQQGKIVAKATVITPNDESANFSGGKLMSGMGLTNVQNIIVLTFSGEACAIPTYDYYLAWTKSNQLVRLPNKENVSDAGVFYHSETFTFPNEKNGKPDMIVWNMSVEEETEKVDKNGEPVLKVTEKKSAVYTWDGVKEKISATTRR